MSKEVKERIGWSMKGVWHEVCASEGRCSFHFGRDRETPCKSFQLYQIDEGKIGAVDIGGVMAIHVVDLYSNKAADVLTNGESGGDNKMSVSSNLNLSVLEYANVPSLFFPSNYIKNKLKKNFYFCRKLNYFWLMRDKRSLYEPNNCLILG